MGNVRAVGTVAGWLMSACVIACSGGSGASTPDGGDGGSATGDGGNGGVRLCEGKPANTVCRAAADPCDVAEVCDGVSPDCPFDAFAESGTACDDDRFCTITDRCDGNGQCVGTGDPCAESRGDGDRNCAESCNEAADDCTGPDPDGVACPADRDCDTNACLDGACAIQSTTCPVHVDSAGADGEGCGQNWGSDACATLEGANAELTRIGASRVFVKQGTYTPVTPNASVLTMQTGVGYYGGFQGGEGALDERPEPVTDHSVLDGEESMRSVVRGASDGRLDGFVVTGGTHSVGGGMLNANLQDLVVTQCVFEKNQASTDSAVVGVGVYNVNSSELRFETVRIADNSLTSTNPLQSVTGIGMANLAASVTLNDVQFVNNTGAVEAFASGGGVYAEESDVILTDVELRGNGVTGGTSAFGGGMMFLDGQATFTRVDFLDNSASAPGGASAGGGGLSVEGAVTLTVEEALFSGNQARGPYAFGGGFILEEDAGGDKPTASLTNVSFVDNALEATANSAAGGGMYLFRASASISGAQWLDNTSDGAKVSYGGGLTVEEGNNITLSDMDFLGNQALAVGGTSGAAGGGLSVYGSTVSVQNVSFAHNRAEGNPDGYGGGLAVGPSDDVADSQVTVDHATFMENEAAGTMIAQGGALHVSRGSVTLRNVPTGGNTPAESGDGFFVDPSPNATLTETATCKLDPGTADQATSGHWFLKSDCVNAADAAAADATFGASVWPMLSTFIDGSPDIDEPDPGRHYAAEGLWIHQFSHAGSDASWTVVAPSGTTCRLVGGGVDLVVPSDDIASGSAEVTGSTPSPLTLTCEHAGQIVRAAVDLP